MLAYYVIWRMKRDLAPMLFKDDDRAAAAAERSSPVAKAKVSPAARRKAINRRTEDGQPVHSFRTLLQDLANLTRNSVRFGDARPTTILSRPTPTQTRAFDPPRPQDRRVGRTQLPYRVTSTTCAHHSRKFGLEASKAGLRATRQARILERG